MLIPNERHGRRGGALISLGCLIYVSPLASHMCVRVRSNLKFNNSTFYWNR